MKTVWNVRGEDGSLAAITFAIRGISLVFGIHVSPQSLEHMAPWSIVVYFGPLTFRLHGRRFGDLKARHDSIMEHLDEEDDDDGS